MADPALQLPETFDTNKAITLSLGLASPLWLAFTGAAVAGSAFWWMSRWTRPENLEAMFDLTGAALDAPPPPIQTPAAAVPAIAIAVTAAETAVDIATHEAAALVEGLAVVDPVVEPIPAPVAEAVQAAADDLTKLVGIGPKLAASLGELGVTSFAQIAAWSTEDLAKFDQTLSLKGRAVRDAWISQARRLAEA